MTNYEIASIVIAGVALLLSVGSFIYTTRLNKKQRVRRVFDELNKHLSKFLDKQFPNAHKKFVVPNTTPAIINIINASLIDDELSRLRSLLFNYKDLINESELKKLYNVIEVFENAYLDLTNNQSDFNLKEYDKNLSKLKKELYNFIKIH